MRTGGEPGEPEPNKRTLDLLGGSSGNRLCRIGPRAVAQEIIGAISDEESGLMQLAHTVQMPSGIETVPVISAAPVAGFVNPAYGGLKPDGAVEWTSLPLEAGEIGTVVGVPNAYLDDTAYPVWESVRGEIARAFTRIFETGALYGTGAPTAWPTGGLTAQAERLDRGSAPLRGSGIHPG
jgi:HK97 family phage major capsid protein